MRQVLPMYEFASAMRNGGFLGLIMGGPAAIPGVTTPPMSRLEDTTTARSMTDPDRRVLLTPCPPFVSGAFADWLRRSGQESRRTRCSHLAGGASAPRRTSPPAGPLGPVIRENVVAGPADLLRHHLDSRPRRAVIGGGGPPPAIGFRLEVDVDPKPVGPL